MMNRRRRRRRRRCGAGAAAVQKNRRHGGARGDCNCSGVSWRSTRQIPHRGTSQA